ETISDADLRHLNEGGIRGIRLNVLFGGGVGLQAFRPLAERIKPMGWHVQLLIHVGRDLAQLAPEIRAIGVPVVVDHMGYLEAEAGLYHPGFQLLLDLVKEGIAWVKLSGCDRISTQHPDYRDAIPTAQALIEAAPDRMVWGTDWPHVSKADAMPDTGILLNRLVDYAPDPALRQRILVDNPARLYGFGDGA
ncbi:MAG: amidohydrolase family protein, partial [Pseudomonadota bacterium]